MSQENTEKVALAAREWLQGATIGAAAIMMERIVTTEVISIPARAGRLQGATIKY